MGCVGQYKVTILEGMAKDDFCDKDVREGGGANSQKTHNSMG